MVLLGGTVFLTLGRAWPRPPCSPGTPPVPAGVARGLIAAGLLLLALAALLDARPLAPSAPADPAAPGPARRRRGRAAPAARPAHRRGDGRRRRADRRPAEPGTIAGLVLCVVLTAVHRWLSAREEQRLAARLRRSEAYFRSLVQSAGDAVVILDDDLRITWASPALERAAGRRRRRAGRPPAARRRCTPTTRPRWPPALPAAG